MSKIKAIIKRPDEEYGHITYISNTLHNLQNIVDGYIEVVNYKGITIICNEEGKLRDLKPNIMLGRDILVGTIIVCGTDGEEFADIPIDFQRWKNIVNMNGINMEVFE